MSHRKEAGLTLVELMIVVVVLAILVGIAYPSYQGYVGRSYRAEAHADLHKLANLQEQYYLDQRQYTANMTQLGMGADPMVSDSGRYKIDATVTTTGFTLTATAQGSQASIDSDCRAMTLSDTGVMTPQECW
ncbi:type IV pilus biogenesis protein PilE [Ferrimonas balearica DSM 9799]|uniref:Type IV pilus biogenesis protein PilE n=1 Tax=Ferrimonas balearica (strain DSM 9799 / CCM 4581 / KCTC 23876 / PAT) TaxID=550540 RepID=E1SSG1_FERBD|nr:type IV pilin protein [Ferrimonas balearica]ADN75001.1 type IV pilus biogenesis protein PilE [Ferrimonas balearica DSM 9799]MBY5981572.1 prepilin-type N-terminal cleavage/methylation domain-containing protein [Ferrimonas balearica]MBY6018963.1 prepilin-type N-terminal cleavage/methylation domain-containing protein [Halomonas denitrificans]MBY6096153.1 prepilin-type N-terminal cleavage/methylation domain-containing protein [Ferrimonas balearica]